jgi:FlaA1/EpsC-like NDP-sugar epimerase
VELARRMISLAGFVPEKDIAIEFVGIRDGEKLQEELFEDNETRETTDIPGIRLARSQVESLPRMRHLRDQILRSGSTGGAQPIVAMLRDFLAESSQRPSLRQAKGQKVATANVVPLTDDRVIGTGSGLK